MKHKHLIYTVLIGLLACGGGTVADPNNPEQVKARIAEIADDIQKAIGDATCSDNSQCAAIAMGNKACGGPAYYLAYSTANTDTDKINSLATEHREQSKRYNQLLGMMSDCAFVMEPPVACIDNKCQIKQ